MDNIQKELIKAGRKDLAQEYYKKVAKDYDFSKPLVVIKENEVLSQIKIVVTAYFDHTKQNKKNDVKTKIFQIYAGYNGKALLEEETNSVLEFEGIIYGNLKEFKISISEEIKPLVTDFDVYKNL